MIPNSEHIRFGIAMKLALTPMGGGKSLFSTTSGEMFQGIGAVKLGNMYTSDAHYSSYHRYMGSDI